MDNKVAQMQHYSHPSTGSCTGDTQLVLRLCLMKTSTHPAAATG